MKLNDLLPSKYLKQDDVVTDCTVTVAGIKKANVAKDDETPEHKWLIKFREFDKPMVLNATNTKKLFRTLGNDTEEWIGGTMELYIDEEVEYAGKVTGGLRLRAVPPATRPDPATPPPAATADAFADDVPF